jgi:sulfide:quinone oxidoreductase
MATVAIIGAGFAGHTAALYLKQQLGKDHEVIMINRYDSFYYIPSWVWVGVGTMKPERTGFKLEGLYRRRGIKFIQGKATEVHPDDNYLIVERDTTSEIVRVAYDYLIVATGPKLNFAGTPGLGPEHGYSHSICTLPHAVESRDAYFKQIEQMKQGKTVKFVIGTGHGGATCQGAAFEYIANLHKDLKRRGLRDKAELLWLSNEKAVGDFGVRGVQVRHKGQILTSAEFMGAAFDDYGIKSEVQRAVNKIDEKTIYWENYEGVYGQTDYDFAMLIPQFLGQPLKYIGANGEDVSEKMVNKAGFVLVDAQYGLSYERLEKTPEAWPSTYQNPNYRNVFAAGIAFAPPGPISQPHVTPNGTAITAAPPRTGMISGIIGRVVGLNVADLIKHGKMPHAERMTEMVAACIASMGDSLWDGSAAVIVIHPVVPNFRLFPDNEGRDPAVTHMEMGLAGAWMKRMLHSTMMYKLQANFGWQIIPE